MLPLCFDTSNSNPVKVLRKFRNKYGRHGRSPARMSLTSGVEKFQAKWRASNLLKQFLRRSTLHLASLIWTSFLTKDEAIFHHEGNINQHNSSFWSQEKLLWVVEKMMHSPKCEVFSENWPKNGTFCTAGSAYSIYGGICQKTVLNIKWQCLTNILTPKSTKSVDHSLRY